MPSIAEQPSSSASAPRRLARPPRPGGATVNWFAWGLFAILAAAALVRLWHISTWSLWEDEEGSLTLAQKPWQGFQGFFPLYFLTLHFQTRWAGIDVGAARVFPALMGLLSIALTYVCFRRHATRGTALLAALLIALNIGHVFFSQSVRYYTLALVFQILAAAWCFDGFERDRPWSLVLSVGCFVLALLTHFSALLLAPALVGYVLLAIASRESAGGYRPRNYLLLGALLAVTLGVFAWRFVQLRALIGGWAIPSARDPLHIGKTVLAYFGIPIVALACCAPWWGRQLSRRTITFLACLSFIPVLELLVIGQLNIVNVTWYYALIALIGFALLAAASLTGLWQRGRRGVAGTLLGATVAYYLLFLGYYHLQWHGDRPRWEEAARYLRETDGVSAGAKGAPPVFASVPGVVAFYLGGDPRQPGSYENVRQVPQHPAELPADCRWFVVEAKLVTPEYQRWFADHCVLRTRFDTHIGPVDRSVLVYQLVNPPI